MDINDSHIRPDKIPPHFQHDSFLVHFTDRKLPDLCKLKCILGEAIGWRKSRDFQLRVIFMFVFINKKQKKPNSSVRDFP